MSLKFKGFFDWRIFSKLRNINKASDKLWLCNLTRAAKLLLLSIFNFDNIYVSDNFFSSTVSLFCTSHKPLGNNMNYTEKKMLHLKLHRCLRNGMKTDVLGCAKEGDQPSRKVQGSWLGKCRHNFADKWYWIVSTEYTVDYSGYIKFWPW